MNSITSNEERDEETCYGYCNEYQPHAVKRMFDYNNGMLYDMRWDEAGNLGQVSIANPDAVFEAGRFLFWTEDNRMHAAVDDRYYSYYAYDHSGGSCGSREQSQACLSYAEMEQRRRSQRRLKLTGNNELLDVNADCMATNAILNEPTLYPSAYMVLTNKGYINVTEVESRASSLALPRCSNVTERKHYYAGTERVAARLGGGGLDALYHAIGNNNTIQTKANLLFDQSLEQVNNRILYENDLECIMRNRFAKEEFGHWIDGIPYQMKAEVKCDHGLFKEMVHSMLDDINHGQEKEVYFYHSDHLGSASWITDFSGVAVQHIQYLPYGEPYINQHPFGYSERFTFTGKERDEETGYGYFGARYMDHELMTMWLSVDPMADKYPSMSPYAYCAWNPVKLIDPDGRDWYQSEDGSSVFWRKGNEAEIERGGVMYKNIGENYTKEGNGFAITYHQNEATYFTTYVLCDSDFETQRDSRTNTNKSGQDGNCFVQSGKMVSHSGAVSEESPKYNITNPQNGIDYAASQVANGYSVRVHVDRDGDTKGDHWVAISYCTIEISTQKPIAFGFFDPGTASQKKGTSGCFTIQSGKLRGLCPYNTKKTYNVTDVRRNRP